MSTPVTRRRFGRRSAALVAFAALDLGNAAALLIDHRSFEQSPAYAAMTDAFGVAWWSIPWVLVGALCAAAAWRDRGGGRLAFSSAVFLKIVWGGLFFWSSIHFRAPTGWAQGVHWLFAAFVVGLIAGWPDPVEPFR